VSISGDYSLLHLYEPVILYGELPNSFSAVLYDGDMFSIEMAIEFLVHARSTNSQSHACSLCGSHDSLRRHAIGSNNAVVHTADQCATQVYYGVRL
jgi:hypothetical protein